MTSIYSFSIYLQRNAVCALHRQYKSVTRQKHDVWTGPYNKYIDIPKKITPLVNGSYLSVYTERKYGS